MVEEMICSVFPTYPCFGYVSMFHDLSLQSHICTLNSIQELFEGNSELSYILIEGRAGIGKTTLCKEICYQWTENNLFTPDELVLLLLLQDPNVQSITSELQLAEYLGINSEHVELFLEYLEYTCGANITVIIDSYDELRHELQDESFFKDLVQRKRLSKARIIITSRPSASYHLYNYPDRKVELFELAESTKNEVISFALKDHPYELKLKYHLCQYLDIAKLTFTPIYLASIVWLCLQKSLPCTRTEMHETFILYAINHHLKVTGVVTDFIETEQLVNFVDLNKLERFAFESLIRGKSTFLEGDLPSDINDIVGYGLMQSTECYNPSVSYRHGVQSVKFYPGIQEYLAAKCVAGLSNEVMVEKFQAVVSMLVTTDLRMQLFDMWAFVFSTVSKPIRSILFSESFDIIDSLINQGYTDTNVPINQGYTDTNAPINQGYMDTNVPINQGYMDTNVPINQGYTDTNVPINQGYTDTNVPINQGYTDTNVPINQGYTNINVPINQGYTDTNAPINQGYMDTNVPINQGYMDTNVPINQGYTDTNVPINQGYTDTNVPINQGYTDTNVPINQGYMDTNVPINQGYTDTNVPINQGYTDIVHQGMYLGF